MVTKSYVLFLASVCRGILSDVSDLHPTLLTDSERDLKRLLSLMETRGLPFVLVDLPAFGKHFDKCLANGHLLRSGIPGFRPYRRRGVIPRLFKGLLLRVFHESGVLRSDPDVLAIRAVRQICRFAKRFRVPCPDTVVKEHVNEFIKTDEACDEASLNWDDHLFDSREAGSLSFRDTNFSSIRGGKYSTLPVREQLRIVGSIQRTADAIALCIGEFRPTEWTFKHGPGAVADDPGGRNHKYDFRHWGLRLERVFPLAEFAFANYSHWVDSVESGQISDMSVPSRLISVPKTLDAPRLIAAEPTANQWCQQSIRDFLYTRVERSWLGRSISFRDQTANQERARSSSIVQNAATIDLSSASDRISCWLVERVFRSNPSLLDALQASRTNHVQLIPFPGLPQVIKLRKFSTMGSAVTFPVQSIVFLVICLAAIAYHRGADPSVDNLKNWAREVRVFGDDLIVPIDCWSAVVGFLHLYGLKVNPHKTFGTGKFRESCGAEWFDGHDVHPTYVLGVPSHKRPESVVSCVDTICNFAKQGYFRTAQVLTRMLPKHFTFASIDLDSGAFGIPYFLNAKKPKTRFNKHLQVREIKVIVPSVKTGRRPAEGNPLVLQYFTEACKARFVQGERLGPPAKTRFSLKTRWVDAASCFTS